MRRRRRRVVVAWLLGAALFALGWVVYGEAGNLLASPDIRAESAATPDPPTSASSAPFLAMPSRDSLAVILERPVFSETRRPKEESSGTAATPSDLRLAGVIIAGSERSVLVQSGAGTEFHRLKVGDDIGIGGWMLVEITVDRIKIRRGTIETELLLDYAAPAPLTPRTDSHREKISVKSAMKEPPKQTSEQPDKVETGSEDEVR